MNGCVSRAQISRKFNIGEPSLLRKGAGAVMMITDKARNITNIRRILMSQYELVVPCHFGMESVLKNEIYDIGVP